MCIVLLQMGYVRQ